MTKSKVIIVQDQPIRFMEINEQDYISLTEMVRKAEGGVSIIEKWLRYKNTIE